MDIGTARSRVLIQIDTIIAGVLSERWITSSTLSDWNDVVDGAVLGRWRRRSAAKIQSRSRLVVRLRSTPGQRAGRTVAFRPGAQNGARKSTVRRSGGRDR